MLVHMYVHWAHIPRHKIIWWWDMARSHFISYAKLILKILKLLEEKYNFGGGWEINYNFSII